MFETVPRPLGLQRKRETMEKILSLSIAIVVATLVAGSRGQHCFTTTTTVCDGDQQPKPARMVNGQQPYNQGPPGKKGPIGQAGQKGEQVALSCKSQVKI